MSDTYEINREWIAIHEDKKKYMYKTNVKLFLNPIRKYKNEHENTY